VLHPSNRDASNRSGTRRTLGRRREGCAQLAFRRHEPASPAGEEKPDEDEERRENEAEIGHSGAPLVGPEPERPTVKKALTASRL